MKRQNSPTKASTDQKIREILSKAEENKPHDLNLAINNLYKANDILELFGLNLDDKQSIRTTAPHKGVLMVQYLSMRANILYKMQEYQEALNCYDEIATKQNPSYKICKARGDCLRKLGDNNSAVEAYNAALSQITSRKVDDSREAAATYNSRALSRMALNQLDLAEEDLQEALRLDNGNPVYLCNMSRLLTSVGRDKEAMVILQKVKDLADKGASSAVISEENERYIRNTLEKIIELNKLKLAVTTHLKGTPEDAALIKDIGELSKEAAILTKASLNLEKIKEEAEAKGKAQAASEFKARLEEMEAQITALEQKFYAKQAQIDDIHRRMSDIEEQVPDFQKNLEQMKKDLDKKLEDYSKYVGENMKHLPPEQQIKLREYYSGFVSTFSDIYITSVAVANGSFKLTEGITIETIAALASLIPMGGSAISQGIRGVSDFFQDIDFKKRAIKILNLAADTTSLNQITGDVAQKIANLNWQKILNTTEESLIEKDEKLKIILDYFKKIGKGTFHVDKHEMPATKLGHEEANLLIKKWLNDEITGDIHKTFVEILTNQPITTSQVVVETPILINDSTKSSFYPANNAKKQGSKSCYDKCTVFRVTEMIYDKFPLNHPKLLQGFLPIFGGPANALELLMGKDMVDAMGSEPHLLGKVAATNTEF